MDNLKPEIISEDRQIERALAHAITGPNTHHTSTDSTRKFKVFILGSPHRPTQGLVSLGTMGLWRTPLLSHNNSRPHRLEFFGIFAANKDGCLDILASAAFRVMRTHEQIDTGTVFVDYVHTWYPKATVSHLYFAEPGSLHPMQLDEIRMGNLSVRFLEVIPITPSEHIFLLKHGPSELEGALLGSAADLSDLKRNPAV